MRPGVNKEFPKDTPLKKANDESIQNLLNQYKYQETRKEFYENTGEYSDLVISHKPTIPDLVIYNKPFNKNECFYDADTREMNSFPREKFYITFTDEDKKLYKKFNNTNNNKRKKETQKEANKDKEEQKKDSTPNLKENSTYDTTTDAKKEEVESENKEKENEVKEEEEEEEKEEEGNEEVNDEEVNDDSSDGSIDENDFRENENNNYQENKEQGGNLSKQKQIMDNSDVFSDISNLTVLKDLEFFPKNYKNFSNLAENFNNFNNKTNQINNDNMSSFLDDNYRDFSVAPSIQNNILKITENNNSQPMDESFMNKTINFNMGNIDSGNNNFSYPNNFNNINPTLLQNYYLQQQLNNSNQFNQMNLMNNNKLFGLFGNNPNYLNNYNIFNNNIGFNFNNPINNLNAIQNTMNPDNFQIL